MARAVSTDFFHVFKFYVVDTGKFFSDAAPQNVLDRAQAGFMRMTIPEISVEVVEYREGHYVWTQKQPGIPSIAECTLARGVVRGNSNFLDLIMKHINGENYRTDVSIYQIHRSPNEPKKKYTLYEAFVSAVTPSSELDASSSEIAVSEVTLVCEQIEIKEE